MIECNELILHYLSITFHQNTSARHEKNFLSYRASITHQQWGNSHHLCLGMVNDEATVKHHGNPTSCVTQLKGSVDELEKMQLNLTFFFSEHLF